MTSKKDELIAAAKAITKEYSEKLTIRQIFYRLVAALKIEGTINSYKRLVNILVEARWKGLISFYDIEDRTRKFSSGDWIYKDTEDIDDYINGYLEDFKDCWQQWRISKWYEQKELVEVWIEKQALEGVFSGVCSQNDVTLAVTRGYPSLTYMYEAYKRLRRKVDKDPDRGIFIYYFGDFDPSGIDIYRNIKDTFDRLAEFHDEEPLNITFERSAITKEQIKKYNIPPMPTKKSDARTNGFIAEHGDRAVELDALDPKVLKEMVQEKIDRHFDDELRKKHDLKTAEMLDKIKERIEDILKKAGLDHD